MIAFCLQALLVLAPSRDEIRDMVRRAEAAYKQQQWDTASRAFADAYAVDPNPDYLFARAQAERFAGRCNVAVKVWDQYLAVETSPPAVREAKVNRAYCEPDAKTDAPPPTSTDATAAAPTHDDAPRRPPTRAWYRDTAGGVLVAVGGVSTVIGASVLGLALSRDRKAASADTEGSYVAAKDAATAPHRAGIVVLSVGGALLVAGVVRWAVVASRGRRTSSRAGASAALGTHGRVGWGFAVARRAGALSLDLRF